MEQKRDRYKKEYLQQIQTTGHPAQKLLTKGKGGKRQKQPSTNKKRKTQ